MVRTAWIFAISAIGCGTSDGVPRYATNNVWIEPNENGIHGFQSWTLFASGWEKRFSETYHVCSIVHEIEGVSIPTGDCDTCTAAWATMLLPVDSDCDAPTAGDSRWTSMSALALGDVPDALGATDPFPGVSLGVFAQYGAEEWLNYGWAVPADNPSPTSRKPWDGTLPFDLRPANYWKLAEAEDRTE